MTCSQPRNETASSHGNQCHIVPLVRRLTLLALLFSMANSVAIAFADDSPWLTGRELETQQKAMIPALTWSNKPLHEALQSFSQVQRIALFRDRRIDPNQALRIALENVAVGDVPRRIAAQLEFGACEVGALTYLGPTDAARELRTLIGLRYAELSTLPRTSHAVVPRVDLSVSDRGTS